MENSPTGSPRIQALNVWAKQAGINPITAWRFRKRGWLETLNIAGRQYVTDEAIEKFIRRAKSGDFHKKHKVPTPPNSTNEAPR